MRALCVTVRDPFRPMNHRHIATIRRRRTIRALAPKTTQPFICLLNGRPALRREWSRKVQDGDTVAFMILPQGGGGGSDPLKMILTLAIVAFAPYATSALVGINGAAALGSFGVSMVTAGIGLIGSAIVNALIPPPRPPSAKAAGELAAASPTYTVAAQGNAARIGQPIPEIFGRHVVYPDFAAMPYTEFSGNEQFLYQLFCIGRGHYDIEQMRIEDTPFSSFEEVQTQIVPPGGNVTLFPARVITATEVSGQEMVHNVAVGPFVANPAETEANTIGFDVVLSRGLYYANDAGGLDTRSVSFRFEAQAIDDDGAATGSWVVLQNVTISARTTTPIRRSYRYSVTAGRYQCRVTRTSAKDTDTRTGNDVAWGGLRAYLPGAQTYGDVTLLAMRVRATDNISNQAARKVNAIVTRRLPIWNGTTWSAHAATRNPAWALAYIAKTRTTDDRINLPALFALSETAAIRGDKFDAIFDTLGTIWESLTMTARVVRAMPYFQGGSLQIMRDEPAPLPVAMFSPRNMLRGTFKLNYKMASEDMADAIDVEYFDSTTWSQKTVRAALPNSASAKPHRFSLFGVTERDQAWREGMYMAAANKYRRRFASFQTEMEGFIPSIGDCVAITHDVPRWGQFAEVVAWAEDTQTITVSESLIWASGNHYLSFRRRDGSPAGPFLCAQTADANVVTLSDWTVLDDTPDTGYNRERSHVAFGPAEAQYIRARVLTIRPRSMNTVEIETVIESDFVHDADTGAVPGSTAWQLPTRYTYPIVTGLTARSFPGRVDQMVIGWNAVAGADYYIVEQSADGETWMRAGEVSSNSYSARALYGATTIVRVAAVGMTRGPWASVAYALGADFMWINDANLMWSNDAELMWN